MRELYNCKRTSEPYRYQMAKFDGDLNLAEDSQGRQSVYIVSGTGCDCPGAQRVKMCRHRKMLQKFLHEGKIGGEWFYDWNARFFYQPTIAQLEPLPTDWNRDVEGETGHVDLVEAMDAVGIPVIIVDEHTVFPSEGGSNPVSVAEPSPTPPSRPKLDRRF